jgi:arylsulfatase A-like enzyme/Tfp pilus assembly protein PilF
MRRALLLNLGCALALAACTTDAPPAGESSASAELLGAIAPSQLNVILVTVDTLRADRLSSYGSQRVETPAMDALARDGVRFSNAASTVPFTLPAHSSMMTGTYPPYHGVRENVGYVLDERLPTLAGELSAQGWSTAAFVSAFVLDSRWGIGRGFDTYFDDFELDGRKSNLGSVQREGRETLSEAVEWLDSRPEGPFFLWLHLYDAHDPYKPPEPFKSRYAGRPYDGDVAWVDSLVGEFTAALEERDLMESSVVMLTADHGEGLGDHREGFHGFFVYDSTMRVPLIVRLPTGDLAGTVVDTVTSHVDLLPTVLDLTGQTIPPRVQGSSLVPLMLGGQEEETAPRAVYAESLYPLLHYGWAPLSSLREGRWKLIDAPQPELYDIEADPEETENLVRREREVVQRLRQRLDETREQLQEDAPEVTSRPELDEETLRQLEALGYAAGRGGLGDDEPKEGRADPKDRIELHQLVMAAQSEVGAGELDTARERLDQAIAVDPSIIEGHRLLGDIALQQEEFEVAAGHFRDALALDDDLVDSVYGLARSYQLAGRHEEALVGYQRLAELSPEDVRAALGTADLKVILGEPEEALAVLQQATEVEDAPVMLLNRIGELLVELGRSPEAMVQFDRAIAEGGKSAAPYYNLAVLHEEAGGLQRAMDLYEKTLELAPAHFQAQFNLGRLYGAKGDLDRQQILYEEAIVSNPEFVRGYYLLAKLLLDRGGDLERAEALTRDGLGRDDDHRAGALGFYVLADVLNRLGRASEAAQAVAEGRRIQALTVGD